MTTSLKSWYPFLHDLSLWALAYNFEFDQVFNDINEPLKNEAKNALELIMNKHYIEELNDRVFVNGQEYIVLDEYDCIRFKSDLDTLRVALIRGFKNNSSIIRVHFKNNFTILELKKAPKLLKEAIKAVRENESPIYH